jgi:hypothetical protein
MRLSEAVVATLRSRRFWWWELGGAVIYGIPAAIRFATNSVVIPFLNFPGFWIGHVIPGNLVEKILVNAFFPGGAGGVAGEVFEGHLKGEAVTRKAKYLRRLRGALLQTAVWSAFQYAGYGRFLFFRLTLCWLRFRFSLLTWWGSLSLGLSGCLRYRSSFCGCGCWKVLKGVQVIRY